MLSPLIALSLLAFLQACGEQNPEQPSTLNSISVKSQRSISIKLGESVELGANDLTIKFVDIKEDSRCPRHTACIQEGQVSAIFNISRRQENKGQTFQLTLKTLQPGLATQNIEGYIITLNRVTPYPEAGMAKADRPYVVTLLIEPAD
jgi:hypothetical protein